MMELKSNLPQRDLDGIYLRVKVDGEWTNRCLTDMSWDEVNEWLTERWNNPEITLEAKIENLNQIAKHFHERLRSIGDALNIYCDDGRG